MIFDITVWAILKIFILVFLGLYIIFSLVVVRQVQLMVSTVKVGFENQLKLLAFVHLLFAIAVLFFALITL
ncbi:MAG: hypothetical protein QY322_03215 [bacterium]|nr:MAG: hypothetical protein QY322_03215 [bacterium]